MSSNQPMDSKRRQELISSLKDIAYSSGLVHYSNEKALEWATTNLHLFENAETSQLKPLFNALKDIAYSTGLVHYSEDKAREWAAANLHLFKGADTSQLKPLFNALKDIAYSTGLVHYSEDKAREWAAANLYLLMGADTSQLKLLFNKLKDFAYSSGLVHYSEDKAREWAATNLHRFITIDIQEINQQSLKKWMSAKGEQAMSNIFVKVISNPSATGKTFWYAIRVSPNGTGFLGWAIPDGTFTQGLDQKQEWSDLRIKPGFSASMVIEMAEHFGWTVVNK